ncbi:MAG: tight adherence protein C [Verrucomicrobiales bacterium]|jgi:tight adherence protein C
MDIFTSIPVELAVALVGLAITGILFTFASRGVEQAEARDTLRQVDGYDVSAAANAGVIDDGDLQGSFMERIGSQLFSNAGDLGRRFTPAGYVEKVRHKFVMTGRDSSTEVDRFIASRVFAAAVFPFVIFFMFVWNPLVFEGMTRIMIVVLVLLVLGLGPDAKLTRAVNARQAAIMSDLPDVLDLLTISVEAGLGFEQALDRTIATVPGPLSTEFARMLGETRAGASRADAMRSMDARIDISEVRSFVLAILQADTFGVSIGRVLRAQADEMRIRRRQIAQEKAQKAPVKMLIPMVFCIFPALFVVILVPAMIQIVNGI